MSDISDPKVKQFLADAMVNGLKTEVETQKERNRFAVDLADDLSRNTLNGVFAFGDEDGIMVEDLKSVPIGIIKVLEGIITFHMITPLEELQESEKAVMARAVLGTVSYAFRWHKDRDQRMPTPKENLKSVPVENVTEFDDDGFGIF